MNRTEAVLRREHGLGRVGNYDFALRRLCVAKEDSWRGITPSNYTSDYNPEPPIFSAKFANCDGYRHILAIANEDGNVGLQDTTVRNYEHEEQALSATQCHYNAVFDLEWAPGQMRFVSASGDHTAQLWEVTGAELRNVRAFVGHTRSVKTAAFRKRDPAVFATGGRDGAIIIWDTRANLNVDLTPRADNCIYSGHVGGPGTPVSQRKRSRTPKMTPNATSSSITGLVFQDTNTLISCGAGDGIIKVWDLRRNYTAYRKEPHPKHSLPYAGSSTFRGFTNLLMDESGTLLYANCMDNTIYAYNLGSYSPNPVARYKGLQNSTFYIKSCLSPDGKYLLSGSSDEKAYIWNVNYPAEPLVALSGHAVEVTCVAWGATHDRPIVTCSDDARHKIWRIGPEKVSEAERAECYRGQAEYVRQFGGPKAVGATHKYNLRELESTPRSLKRLVEANERTPGSMEKVTTKRSFLEMLGAIASQEMAEEQQETKRQKTTESRARRLFGPSSSGSNMINTSPHSVRHLSVQLSVIPEECAASTSNSVTPASPTTRTQPEPNLHNDSNQENQLEAAAPSYLSHKPPCNTNTTSPLSERLIGENHNFVSPPNSAPSQQSSSETSSQQSNSLASVIFSPTSNLPNYVLDGEAPHLSIMSPKRKHKEKVDWLTKIRKQKQLSFCHNGTLTDKMQHERVSGEMMSAGPGLSSPRLQSLRQAEGSPRFSGTPRRRMSSNMGHSHDSTSSPSSTHQPKTPTSSRRNSETTLLRFFSVRTQQRSETLATDNVTMERETDTIGLQPLPRSPNNATQVTTCTE